MPSDLQSRFEFERASSVRFAEYHAANPEIYQALRTFALEAKRAGRERIGIKMLFEVVRWHTSVTAKDDTFKLNNNHHAAYARLLMSQESELRGFFELRKSKGDA